MKNTERLLLPHECASKRGTRIGVLVLIFVLSVFGIASIDNANAQSSSREDRSLRIREIKALEGIADSLRKISECKGK